MGFDMPFEYMGVYFENGNYSINIPDSVDNKVKNCIMGKITQLNRMTIFTVNEENYKEIMDNGIVSYWCFEDCSILFRTFGTKTKYGFINEAEGMVFAGKYVRSVWLFIDKLIALLAENEFYALQDTCIIKEELLYKISDRKNNLWNKLLMDKSFDGNITLSDVPKTINYISKNLKLENNMVHTMANVTDKISVSDVLSLENLHADMSSMEDYIYYEYPNAKKHAKEQGFFKATKEIMDMKKSGKVFWYLNEEENTYIEQTIAADDILDLKKLKK